MYMAGFFPIMMFGLIGAAAAFIKTAKPENKNKVTSIMIAAGFITFFTGVTEPIEFAFMFLAPGLYLIHAILTGISVFIAASMHWIAGFAFSRELIDFILSSGTKLANKPYMLIVQGLVFMLIYYFVFVAVITKFDLKIPGREDVDEDESEETSSPTTHTATAEAFLEYLGGADNLVEIDNFATRLRLEIKDQSLVQKEKIKKIAARVLTPGKTSVQVIVGPHVEFVCDELKRLAK